MYTWDPSIYERSSSAQYQWAIDALSELEIRGDERILDIGCGDGKITAYISQLVPDSYVTGIDISDEMIAFAKHRHPEDIFKNLRFRRGDALQLDFNEEFDIVLSFACLHWVQDHITVLRGIRKSLVPGGKTLLQCGGRGNAAQLLDVTSEVIEEEPFAPYFENFAFPYFFYTPEDYDEWLEAAGLHKISVKLIPKDMIQKEPRDLEAFIRATWLPYLKRLPHDLQPQLVKEIARRYIERYPANDQGIHVRMVRLQALAEKR